MSENWNPNAEAVEDDDLEDLEVEQKEDQEANAKKWAELIFGKTDEAEEEESTSVFDKLVGKIDSVAEDAEDVDSEAQEDPSQTILEQPTFREDDPGEDSLARSESENFSTSEDSQDIQEDVVTTEGTTEDQEPVSEVIDNPDDVDGSEEKNQQLEFSADQVDGSQDDQEIVQVESEEDPDQESVLKIDRSEIIDEPIEDIELEQATTSETTRLDTAEIDSSDTTAEIEDAAIIDEEDRLSEGDQSEIISSEEAEELEAQVATTEDPSQTILEQPTFREDEPEERESSRKESEVPEEELSAEDDPLAVTATAASLAAASALAARQAIKDENAKVSNKGEQPLVENSDSKTQDELLTEEAKPHEDLKGESLEQEDTTNLDESAPSHDEEPSEISSVAEEELHAEAERAVDVEVDKTEADIEAAYIYAATEGLTKRPEAEISSDEKDKTAVVSNQELSSQTHEDIEDGSNEEVDVERLSDHPEIQPYDPEAESFDKRQETISQGPPKDTSDYYGDAHSSQDATPISDILADKEQQMANFDGMHETTTDYEPEQIPAQTTISSYKPAIIKGMIAGLVIIIIASVYMFFIK